MAQILRAHKLVLMKAIAATRRVTVGTRAPAVLRGSIVLQLFVSHLQSREVTTKSKHGIKDHSHQDWSRRKLAPLLTFMDSWISEQPKPGTVLVPEQHPRIQLVQWSPVVAKTKHPSALAAHFSP